MSELIKTREGRVLRLTLNRPEKNNLLTSTLRVELWEALNDAAADGSTGAILLDAAGSMFCGGLDMEEILGRGPEETAGPDGLLFNFGLDYPKPVVAAVQGPCLGAGVGLAANAHVVVAAQGVKFGLTEIRYGSWPYPAHRALVAAMGERRVVELAMSGRIFGAQDALQYGLVQEIAPAFELDDRATATARHLAACSPDAMRRGLEFVRRFRTSDVEKFGEVSEETARGNAASADFAEGVRAMRESRKPNWPSLEE